MTAMRPRTIADGAVHTVRIVYYKFINYDFLNYFTASSALTEYLKDNGEVRRRWFRCTSRAEPRAPQQTSPCPSCIVVDVPWLEPMACYHC